MSKFSELMKQPLPSARDNNDSVFTEGYDGCEESFDDPFSSSKFEPFSCPSDNCINPSPECPSGNCDEPAPMGSEVDTTPLTSDQSQRVDDTINAVATPILINGELNDDQIKEFVESMDSDIAVNEGFLTEKTIIKFDKNAKRAQLYEVAVAAVAREKKDPLYKKLQTVYKMERIIKAKLRKKYHSQAQQKVKEYLARAKKSKSGILARIANKITGK